MQRTAETGAGLQFGFHTVVMPLVRGGHLRARNRAPMQARFQSLRVQSLVYSYLGSSEENRTPISALKGPHPGR